jgi:hypothetical protein
MYNFFWSGAAMIGLWLLWRIFEVLKAIHFMMSKWFDRDYIKPFDRAHGIDD